MKEELMETIFRVALTDEPIKPEVRPFSHSLVA
jgi:hypothetical protein